jgi:hypothetical protein
MSLGLGDRQSSLEETLLSGMAGTKFSSSTKDAFFPEIGPSAELHSCLLGTGSKKAGERFPTKTALELLCLQQVSDF